VQLWTDVLDRTGDPLWPKDMASAVDEAVYYGARTIIVTGKSVEQTHSMLLEARATSSQVRYLIGGGVTAKNLPYLIRIADGVIVGNYLHEESGTRRRVSSERATEIVRAFRA
jgi:predicted TIM-barrel enzyme